MAGEVKRREQMTPNPENKIRALALPAETMKAQCRSAGSRAKSTAWERDGAGEEAGAHS